MLKIDNKAKKVIIGQQAFQKANEETLATLQRYTTIGYEVEVKQPKRVKGDKTTDADIRAALAKDEKALATYEELKKVSFFKAKRFFKEYMANK